MSPDALRALRFRVDSLLAGRPKAAHSILADPGEEVVEAMLTHLKRKGCSMPLGVVKRAPWWPKLKKDAAGIADYLTAHAPAVMTKRLVRQRAYYIVVGILVRWVERIGIPVTPRSLAQNMDKVPGILDQQFPGYAESGYLGWVFKSRR